MGHTRRNDDDVSRHDRKAIAALKCATEAGTDHDSRTISPVAGSGVGLSIVPPVTKRAAPGNDVIDLSDVLVGDRTHRRAGFRGTASKHADRNVVPAEIDNLDLRSVPAPSFPTCFSTASTSAFVIAITGAEAGACAFRTENMLSAIAAVNANLCTVVPQNKAG